MKQLLQADHPVYFCVQNTKIELPVFYDLTNGGEFIADVLARWADEVGVTLYFIEPGSPWMNGRVDNARLRDELLNSQLFENVAEAQVFLDTWHHEYNHRPHSSLGYLSLKRFLPLPEHEQRKTLRDRRSRCSGKENTVNKWPRSC